MRIEIDNGVYRLRPSEGASPAGRPATPRMDSQRSGRTAAAVDRAEIGSLPFPAAAKSQRPDAAGSLRARLVAGSVRRSIDFGPPPPPGAGSTAAQRLLHRAYFLDRRDLADMNAAAVREQIDLLA